MPVIVLTSYICSLERSWTLSDLLLILLVNGSGRGPYMLQDIDIYIIYQYFYIYIYLKGETFLYSQLRMWRFSGLMIIQAFLWQNFHQTFTTKEKYSFIVLHVTTYYCIFLVGIYFRRWDFANKSTKAASIHNFFFFLPTITLYHHFLAQRIE